MAARPPADEVWVVSDASTDDSESLARDLGASVIRLESHSGPSKARNVGARAASGELLLFLDADVSIPPDLIERVRETFEGDGNATDAFFGSYDDSPACGNFMSQYRNLLHHFVHQNGKDESSTFWTGCGAIRRQLFLDLGGFNESRRYLEDVELGYRVTEGGHRIRLIKSLQAKHHKRWNVVSTLVSDVLHRAYPWTELIWDYSNLPNDLNVGTASRASAVILGLLGAALLGSGMGSSSLRMAALTAVPVFVIVLVLLNFRLYRWFWTKRGPFFALRAAVMHWIYYACASVTFAVSIGCFTLVRRKRGRLSSRKDPHALEVASTLVRERCTPRDQAC
jgi:GT2 family glycosyltransferase